MDRTVLIIEDEISAVEVIEYALQAEGYTTLTAMHADKGIALAQEHQPDLILMDIMLPEIDGFEICRRLKAEPDTSSIPVIMLSARAQHSDAEAGLIAGAECYLTKPIDMTALVNRVKDILGG